jgi:hypothetical protein
MGAWGIGLYSSDMAADMRSTVKSVLRLPFDENRIVDILCDGERKAAIPTTRITQPFGSCLPISSKSAGSRTRRRARR